MRLYTTSIYCRMGFIFPFSIHVRRASGSELPSLVHVLPVTPVIVSLNITTEATMLSAIFLEQASASQVIDAFGRLLDL